MTVGDFTISFTCKIKVDFVTIMASFTSSIDDWLTIWNYWNFTNLLREIQCVSKNTCFTITNVIFTLCTVCIVALSTNLWTVFVGNEIPRFAFWTVTVLYTNLTVLNSTFLFLCLLSSQKDLWSNAAIIISVSTDVSITTKSPVCSPWVLYDPLSFSITDQ